MTKLLEQKHDSFDLLKRDLQEKVNRDKAEYFTCLRDALDGIVGQFYLSLNI